MTLYIIGFIILRILAVFTFGLIIFKAVLYIKKKSYEMHEKYAAKKDSNALNILKARFASGEIDENEYKEMNVFLKSLHS
jgi:uncharacterized membrane protein